MASLTIKNIPDELYDHLKQSAQAHHRSINGELIYYLEKALKPNRVSAETLKQNARALRARVKLNLAQQGLIDTNEIDAAKNTGRP